MTAGRLLERSLRRLPAEALRELAGLLHRAAYSLEHGWPAAALDSLGRAAELLEQEHGT